MAGPDGAIQNSRSYELVARAIEQQILDNHIAPGDVLPAETTLAAQLGVNRSTLREALRTLEQNGLVVREPGRKKLRISAPRPKDIAHRISSSMIIQQVTFQELYEGMLALEPACAAAAATRISDDHLAALEENLAQTRAASESGANLAHLDAEFHRLVASAGQNRVLELAREPLGQLFYPAFEQVMSRLNVANRLLVAHTRIFEAIATRDAATARTWMDRHIEDFRRGYELAGFEMEACVKR